MEKHRVSAGADGGTPSTLTFTVYLTSLPKTVGSNCWNLRKKSPNFRDSHSRRTVVPKALLPWPEKGASHASWRAMYRPRLIGEVVDLDDVGLVGDGGEFHPILVAPVVEGVGLRGGAVGDRVRHIAPVVVLEIVADGWRDTARGQGQKTAGNAVRSAGGDVASRLADDVVDGEGGGLPAVAPAGQHGPAEVVAAGDLAAAFPAQVRLSNTARASMTPVESAHGESSPPIAA